MRLLGLLGPAILLFAGPAAAHTISVVLITDNSSCFNNIDSACSQNGAATFDDFGSAWSTTGGTSPSVSGPSTSTSTSFSIDAVTAVDDGGVDVGQSNDRSSTASLDFDILLTIDVDYEVTQWSVDLTQSVLGLFGLRGDGTLSAVGTQDNGSGSISTILTTVGGTPYNFSAAPSSYANNPSNTSSASQQFSGSRIDGGILSGTGDATVSVNISFDLTAFSNDGCSSFLCSSASGGEEAAVLFGSQSVMDQAVDDYGTWGRALGPDGYNSTWTLNVTAIPEPTTALLLGAGLAALGALQRRRRA